jgi:squalene synthase HpnC
MASAILDQLDTFGPQRCQRLDYPRASAYAERLTRSQYENFTVVSWFLPQRLRNDFHHIYAFCRWADDLGDEVGDPSRSLELLSWWRQELDACYAGEPRHPVFVALERTIREHDIPRQPFDDLIDAFMQDQRVSRYATWDEVLDYCSRSANPVGRLVLYVAGYRDPARQRLSDATCTALQLANFWQDVRRDILERDRIYVPQDVASAHGLDVELMASVVRSEQAGGAACRACGSAGQLPAAGTRAILPAYRATLRELVGRTWPLFHEGRSLLPRLAPDVRLDVKLFTLGGEAVLRMIERIDYETLHHRPQLGRGRKVGLMMRAGLERFGLLLRRGGDERG